MGLRILDLFFRPLLLLSLLQQLAPVSAQTTNATCLSTWAWASNSRQQSPCLVAAYLLAPCANGQWEVPALSSGQYYLAPSVAVANQCECSTVAYQLMSACGSCQGQDIITWSSWSANCASGLISIASYPRPIPTATSVPAWAYLNITAADRFNATIAQADSTQSDSSAGGSTSTTPSTSATSTTGSSSSSSTSPVSNSSSSNDTGAIAGGVVGGVVGLGLIVCLIIFLVKRKEQRGRGKAPSAEFSKVIPPGSPVPLNFDPAAVGFRSRTNSPMSNGLSNDSSGGYGMQNMHHAAMVHANGAGVTFGGSPWSPPPVGHTPAPSSGHYSTIYTPPPPEMNQGIVYTPPPGSLNTGSAPSHQYSHSQSNSISTGYNPTTPYPNMNPYAGGVQQHINRPRNYPEI